MTLLREIIATELETCKLQDRHFKLNFPSKNDKRLVEHSPLADITNTQECDIQHQSTKSCQSKITKSNQNLQDTDTDSDFENDSRKYGKVRINHAPALQEIDSENKPGPLEWDHLDPSLKALLPSETGLTYVITELNHLPAENFPGAPEYSYEATVRINLTNKEAAQSWIQKMMQHSKCTYRHSKGRAPGLKRVLYKAEMHCQHQRKKLTPKQQQKASVAKSKNSKKVLTHEIRMKKTDCPSNLTMTVLVPTKKDRLASDKTSYLLTHPTVLKVTFNHNHPLTSAQLYPFVLFLKKSRSYFLNYFVRVIQQHQLITGMRQSFT
jgi:hypothetical protein